MEEEKTPYYRAEDFYPVHTGEVVNSRYRVVAKLGFGTASTVWLCQDLTEDRYVALKVCTTNRRETNELAISHHIKSVEGDHPGRGKCRVALDDFELQGPHGKHVCLVFAPRGLTFTKYRRMVEGDVFGQDYLQYTMLLVAFALDFLHQAGVVHTGNSPVFSPCFVLPADSDADISPNNILLGVSNPAEVFSTIESQEVSSPSPRKLLPDRTIYLSQAMPVTKGGPMVSDLGSAFLGAPGQKHSGDVMPNVFRAPEIILDMQWDSSIDVWGFGMTLWNLFEGKNLFHPVVDGFVSDELHLAEMVSLMGPPPKQFLERSEKSCQFWDADGNWTAQTSIPDQSLETLEKRLNGQDKELLLNLMRKILQWLPEERISAQDLTGDPFLLQFAAGVNVTAE